MTDRVDSLLPLTPAVLHILLAVAGGPRHGYAIAREVEAVTDGRVRMGPGTLYGSIQRMQDAGLIREADARAAEAAAKKKPGGAASDPAPDGRAERRRYYEATPLGVRVLRAEAARLQAVLRLVESRIGA